MENDKIPLTHGKDVEDNKIPQTHGKDVEKIPRSDETSDQQRVE